MRIVDEICWEYQHLSNIPHDFEDRILPMTFCQTDLLELLDFLGRFWHVGMPQSWLFPVDWQKTVSHLYQIWGWIVK